MGIFKAFLEEQGESKEIGKSCEIKYDDFLIKKTWKKKRETSYGD